MQASLLRPTDISVKDQFEQDSSIKYQIGECKQDFKAGIKDLKVDYDLKVILTMGEHKHRITGAPVRYQNEN